MTGTPEELIVDFGLNTQPFGVPTEPVKITQRIVTNYYTAKRMLHALTLSVQRHEQVFGVLETDIQKTLRGEEVHDDSLRDFDRAGRHSNRFAWPGEGLDQVAIFGQTSLSLHFEDFPLRIVEIRRTSPLTFEVDLAKMIRLEVQPAAVIHL